jgi:membrane protease YdiL (CAAX protease family)
VREFIRGLSDRSEFLVVCLLCFSYSTVTSLLVLLSRVQFEITTVDLLFAIAEEVVLLALVLAILQIRGWTIHRLGLRFSWRAVLAGVPLFIWYFLIYWLLATAAIAIAPSVEAAFANGMHIQAAPAAMVLFIVLNSFFEEITVTGYVVTALEKEGAALAITASTLIRFGYHLYQGPVASLSILPLGLLFGVVYWKWRTLWPLIIAHTIANFLAFGLK